MKRKYAQKREPKETSVQLPFTGIVDTARVAAQFHVDRKTVENWRSRNIIPYFKIGRTVRFDAEVVMSHLRATCQVGGAR